MPRASSVEFGSGAGAAAKEWVLKPNQTRINMVINEASKHLEEPRLFDAEVNGKPGQLAEAAMVWTVVAVATVASVYAIYSVCVFIEEYTNCFSNCALRLLKPKLRLSSSKDCPSDCNKKEQKKRMESFQKKDSDADVEEEGYDPRVDNVAITAEDGDDEEDGTEDGGAGGVVEVVEVVESGTCAADAATAKSASGESRAPVADEPATAAPGTGKQAKQGKRPSVVRFASDR
jgi:hypothetical protein